MNLFNKIWLKLSNTVRNSCLFKKALIIFNAIFLFTGCNASDQEPFTARCLNLKGVNILNFNKVEDDGWSNQTWIFSCNKAKKCQLNDGAGTYKINLVKTGRNFSCFVDDENRKSSAVFTYCLYPKLSRIAFSRIGTTPRFEEIHSIFSGVCNFEYSNEKGSNISW